VKNTKKEKNERRAARAWHCRLSNQCFFLLSGSTKSSHFLNVASLFSLPSDFVMDSLWCVSFDKKVSQKSAVGFSPGLSQYGGGYPNRDGMSPFSVLLAALV
jgi:hypothetical protein